MPDMGLGGLAGQQAQAVPEADGENLTPEEQAAYDELVSRTMIVLFDEKTKKPRQQIIDLMAGEEDPKVGLGKAAAMGYFRVLKALAENGTVITPEVEQEAGIEVFELFAEVATKSGIYDFDSDQDAMNGAFYIAADELRQMKTDAGMMDQEQSQQDFAQMAQMDESGELEQIMAQVGQQEEVA